MRSKLLFLMLAAIFLFAAGSARANLLSNPGFEVEAPGTTAADRDGNWYIQTYGAGTWNWEDGSSAEGAPHTGDKFLYLDGIDTYGWVWIEQDVPVTPGEEYFLSVWHKDGSRSDDPETGHCDFGVEWYDSGGGILGDGSTVAQGGTPKDSDADYDIESISVWQQYIYGVTPNPNSSDNGVGKQLIAPAGAAYARVALLHWWATWPWVWGRGLNIDDLWFSTSLPMDVPVHTPNPSNGQQGVPPDPIPNTPAGTTTLSWKKDYLGCGFGKKVEVYWGKQADPNFWYVPGEAVKIMALADVNDFDLGDAIGGPVYLQPDEVYYWALKYDPNECNADEAELKEGPAWSFDTINRPPTVDAGLHYDRWQDAVPTPIKIGLDASYSDDGLPVGGNLTYTWSETLSGGATTPTYPDGRNVEDPNVIFDTAGDYILKLTVHDDFGGAQDKTGEDTTLVRIFANNENRLRAHYELNGNALDSDILPGGDTHNGSLVDNPGWGTGQVAGAVELDGTDDLLSDGLNDSVEIGDTGSDPNWQSDTWENSDLIDGMTVSAWMKLDEDGWSKSWETIVAKNNSSWELDRDGSNDNVRFVIQSGVGEATSSGVTDVESGWHQVVGVYDRNTIKIYVDGLEAGSGDANPLNLEAESNFDYLGQPINDQDWQVPKAAGKILVGACSNVTGDLAFAGLIDQVRIFDAAVPKWAEHAGTPGIVEMYRADGGHDNCGGVYLAGDTNEDCYITLADFAIVAKDWLECNDEANADCD